MSAAAAARAGGRSKPLQDRATRAGGTAPRRETLPLASAIERYAVISGSGFGDIPESFLRDRVFDGLGDVLTMTLETKNSTLWEWNADTRRRWEGQPFGFVSPAPLQSAEFKNATRPD